MLDRPIDEDANSVGLLDVAVVAAENWILLLVAPVIAGLIAFGAFALATPQTYQSAALLRLTPAEAALIRSERTLTPALDGTAYLETHSGSYSKAVHKLTDQWLTVTREGETDLYRVSVTDGSAEGAQDLLARIINSLIANSTPTPAEAALLAIQINQTERSIAELETNLARTNRIAANMEDGAMPVGATIGELGQTLVALTANIEERYRRLFEFQEALKGSVSTNDIVQAPTLADSPEARGLFNRAAFVAIGVGLLALFLTMLVAGWKEASRTADGLDKISRIRRAFGLRPAA